MKVYEELIIMQKELLPYLFFNPKSDRFELKSGVSSEIKEKFKKFNELIKKEMKANDF